MMGFLSIKGDRLPEESENFPWKREGEIFRVETPEMTVLEFPVADLGSRITAVFLDYLILAGLGMVLAAFLFLLFLLGKPDEGVSLLLFSGAILLWFFGSILYFVWFEVHREGQTPGKRRIGLRVVHLSGRGLSLGPSLLRNLARFVDQIPIFLVIPALLQGRRRIGDLLAQTIVVQETKPDKRIKRRLFTKTSLNQLGGELFFLDSRCLSHLDPEDLNLLEYLEDRIPTMGGKQKRETLKSISERYVQRLGLEDRKDAILEDPQRLLSELAFLLRRHYRREL
jgi:uncharacterized RDD family membrane protein YckC